MPVGSSEHAVSMISSGIDSPVASFEMLRRGVHLTYIHFHSMPVTNRQSIKNVQDILMILSKYQIKSKLFLVPILEIQRKIMSEIPDKFWVILFRRAMFKITSIIAENINAPAIVSGESVGQVASQTLSNIRATANSADRPVLRPLCGMNKIGASTEVKNTIFLKGAKAPHHNYVGDSIIGEQSNLGSGTKIANLRFDKRAIEVIHKGEKIDSGRRKLGAIIGSNVNTGINASINAGSIIGNDVRIGPNTLVSGTYESKSTIA